MFSKDELNILWPFYLSIFIKALFVLISPYFLLYFMDVGLTFFQISILFSTFYFTSIIFDIPTGAVADLYGRKFSVVLSYIFTAIIIILIPFFTNFYYLLILFLIWGITDTLRTGADEAWVISNLKEKSKPSLIETFYSKSMSIGNVGVVVAPLIAAFIVSKFNMSLLWILQGISVFVATFVLLFAKERFKKDQVHIRESFKKVSKQSKDSISFSLKHPVILKLLISIVFLSFILSATSLLWQPYLKDFNLPLPYFGYILSLAGFLAIFGPILTTYFSKKFSKKSNYLSLLISIHLIILLLVYFINSLVLAAFVVIILYVAISFILPVERPFFQRFVPDEKRATIGSFNKMVATLGSGVAMLLVGFLADFIGAKNTLASMGFFLIPSLWLYLRIKK